MENKAVVHLIFKAEKAVHSLIEFAEFVNDAEFFAVQNPQIFDSEEKVSDYSHLWTELELVNACALSEWEDMGKGGFHELWIEKYYNDAKQVVEKLKLFLEAIVRMEK